MFITRVSGASQSTCLLVCCNSCFQTSKPQTSASSWLRCSQNHPVGKAVYLRYNCFACTVDLHTLVNPGEKLLGVYITAKLFDSQKISSTVAQSSSISAQILKLLFLLRFTEAFFLNFYFRHPYKDKTPVVRAGIWAFLAGTPALGKHTR